MAAVTSCENALQAILENTIILFVCPPKFCISIVSSLSWDLQCSREKTITMLMQNLGGQTKSIMVFSKMANRKSCKELKTDIQTKTQYTFFACRFCFPNTDHVTILRRVFSFKVGQFHVRTQSI